MKTLKNDPLGVNFLVPNNHTQENKTTYVNEKLYDRCKCSTFVCVLSGRRGLKGYEKPQIKELLEKENGQYVLVRLDLPSATRPPRPWLSLKTSHPETTLIRSRLI